MGSGREPEDNPSAEGTRLAAIGVNLTAPRKDH
jgi:hypothetical protein